ncbi:MAG: protein kinase [Planctomycetes bacterium]|nr:protein kinase [Planctomycetota bacterium]
MRPDSRLERAMDVFLRSQADGVPQAEAIAQHPDLAELLTMLWADGPPAEGAEGDVVGPFRLVRELGRGGMGVVHEAHQTSLGRRVALKVLGTGATLTAAQVARFRREALVLARLDHSHVVRVVDVGENDGRHWLAMELVDGCSLAEHLDRLRTDRAAHRGELRSLVQGVAQIAEALQHVHDAGILHRDVKPSNLLLHRDGRWLLSDFGLARDDSAPTVTRVGATVGTPNYMSPEQVVAATTTLTPGSDVFSLGATLYECITLQRPFDGPSTDVVLRQILAHDPIDPRRLLPGLPADLAAIVGKALEKDVARRYASAGAMANDLRAFLELQPVYARLPSLPRRVHRWVRQRPLRAVVAAMLFVCAGFGVLALAKLQDLRAAESARVQREFESRLSTGMSLSTSRRGLAAITELRRALELDPTDATAIAGLCLAIQRSGDLRAAEAEFERRAPFADDQDTMRRLRTMQLQNAGRREEAESLRASLPPPRSPSAFWLLGSALLLGASHDQAAANMALENLSLAMRLAPAPRIVWAVQWAVAANMVKDAAAMRECRETLLRHWPDDALALHYAALVSHASDPAGALDLCLRAREKGMDPQESAWLEVTLRDVLPDDAAMLVAVRRCLAFPQDDVRKQALLEALARRGDPEGEAREAEAWLRSEPANLEAKTRMAIVLDKREQHEPAIALFAEVAAARPNDPDSWYRLAVAQHVGNQDEAAHGTLARVLEMAPDHERAHTRLLDVLADLEDVDAILRERRRWANVRSRDAAAHLELAKALLDAEPPDPDGALAAATAADVLAGGQDVVTVEMLTRIHEGLGDRAAAANCRARATVLRGAASANGRVGR